MTARQFSAMLNEELAMRRWTVRKLAQEADLPYETVRRVVRGMGLPSLASATKLLVTVERTLPHGLRKDSSREGEG